MALNDRMKAHIERTQAACSLGVLLAMLCKEITQAHAEEFATGQDNVILNDDIEAEYHIKLESFNEAVNQFCAKFTIFWEGTDNISQRKHGKDARGVSNNDGTNTSISF
jgi:hypothetical protein